MNACTMFAWWGFNLWLPGYLALPVTQGGVGLSTDGDVGVRRGDAGRDVVRVRDVRLRQRLDRTPSRVRALHSSLRPR